MKIKLLSAFIFCQIGLFAQTEFKYFLQIFPKVDWNELDFVLNEEKDIQQEMDIQEVNQNMFGEHTKKERKVTIDYPYPTRPPHIKIGDTTFMLYHNGYHGRYDSNPNHPSKLTPLARIEFDNGITMIVFFN